MNLKQAAGRSIILDLVKDVDVVYVLQSLLFANSDMYRVDNFIPGKLEELGLGYKVFAETNPSIIHASISGTMFTPTNCDSICS